MCGAVDDIYDIVDELMCKSDYYCDQNDVIGQRVREIQRHDYTSSSNLSYLCNAWDARVCAFGPSAQNDWPCSTKIFYYFFTHAYRVSNSFSSSSILPYFQHVYVPQNT